MKKFFLAFVLIALCTMPSALQAQELKTDSLVVKINNKIIYYQGQQAENNKIISDLQKEIDERKKLDNRLEGAILGQQELLKEITAKDSTKVK